MRLKSVVVEDFCNYRQPSLFLVTAFCDWKCCTEQGLDTSVCQNAPLAAQPTQSISNVAIYNAFHENDITKAVVVGGLEPFLQADELYGLISYFRLRGESCYFVVYTGYEPHEIADEVKRFEPLGNIIIKFGRYIPNSTPVYDDILGVTLASSNQYARVIA